MKKTICLGIEGTAHTAGIGIVDEKCRALANEKHSHATLQGGLIPRELAEHHAQKFPGLINAAIRKSGVKWSGIGCVAYSAGPGIGPALSVAAVTARMLALLHSKPIVPVNHAVAHIEIARKKCNSRDPLIIYVSGGNTQAIGYDGGRYRVYGETIDIGVGNLLDSFGRELGMGFPAGPKMDETYFGERNYIELPYTVKGMDLSFSGLLTAAQKKIGKEKKEDIVYSLMHTSFAMICEVCERALAHTGKKELLVTGGVASSKALREMLSGMCRARGVKLLVCPREYATDNGAMIAWTGLLMHNAGRAVAVEKAFTEQRFRVDGEIINWTAGKKRRVEK